MNIIVPRGIFQVLNLIIFAIITLLLTSMLLVARGHYNIAVTIMAFGVLVSLIFNARGTEATGSAERFIASEFSFMMPILFSMLFCRRWVLVTVSVIAEAAILYTLGSSDIVDPSVRYVVIGSTSITVIISFIIAMMMNKITETSKQLRAEDAEREQAAQREINEGLMQSMQDVSGRLDESSRGLSGDAAHFAGNIQEQASSIEEITATMEEISSGSEQVSAGAQRQSELMDALMGRMNELVGMARDMESRIAATLKRTGAISATAREGEAYIGKMDASMSEIGATSKEMTGILGIINDISDRINLLSLNAAIEAARAGDYGRGFAVVADEISKLADQTSSSVKEIAGLIAKSESEVVKGMSGVRDTVTVMREIIAGVEESNRMIAAVNAAMEKSIESTGEAHGAVNTVKDRADEIATASGEQKTAALEIMNTITDINQLSQTNAARAEDITGHAKDIASMAKDLKDRIAALHDGASREKIQPGVPRDGLQAGEE
jgi:methyl-accepting chemotaxis protein